ncbi:ATP-binding protein [Streptomyces sp. NPDC059785]|uniref:ATP-binding protein n=1 Tax=unclassified Streptomyces TaxID=2593676 RepID=UPI0036524AF9
MSPVHRLPAGSRGPEGQGHGETDDRDTATLDRDTATLDRDTATPVRDTATLDRDTATLERVGEPGPAVVVTGPAAAPPRPPSAVTTAAAARQYVKTLVREEWNSRAPAASEEAVIDLLLVVSEMVTNAIRHGEGLAGFHATLTDDGMRLAVRDNSEVIPVGVYGSGAVPRKHTGNGYGWPLIIRLAREIEVERCPGGGKTISVLVPLT